MFKHIAVVCLSLLIALPVEADTLPKIARAETPSAPQPENESTRSTMTDAAVVAALVAASITLYKIMSGGPCACDYHLKSNGALCGKNSAHYRRNGYKPLCGPADVSVAMIQQYRATGAIPPIR